MLYKIIANGPDVFELNPGLLSVPAYKELTEDSRWMIYVILVCDQSPDNPIRTLPEKQRKERAIIIAGYPKEGNAPNKNARNIIAGNHKRIEEAIAEFKRNHYDENQANLESIINQIAETREFLNSEKKVYLISKGQIVLDRNGKEVMVVDDKKLELAMKLGKQLPDLVEAKQRLEALTGLEQQNKFEGITGTVSDIADSDSSLSMIDQVMQNPAMMNRQ
jgi:hypothetical protein